MTAWKVYRHGRLLSVVYYDDDCTADYVRRSLIAHDNYPSNIHVSPARSRGQAGEATVETWLRKYATEEGGAT